MKYAPFNVKQVAYYTASFVSWLNVAEGGKRAGKNILNILAFAENLETHPNRLHLTAGVTKATSKVNIWDSDGFGLTHYFKGRCREGTYEGIDCLYIRTKTGTKIVIAAGGKDSDDYRSIKGFSFGSVYVTEANECHQLFIQEVVDRTIASQERRIFFDINPKPPRHWFYSDFLDFQDKLKEAGENPGYNYAHFTLFDNMSLSNKRLKEVLSKYDRTSLWYQADILGKRTSATGRIYTAWSKENVIDASRIHDEVLVSFSIGVDIGGTDATVATLAGYTHHCSKAILVDGYYHKQGKYSGMTHDLYARQIVDRIEEWIVRYPRVSAAAVFVESADKLFRQALKNELDKRGLSRMSIAPSYKKDGIVDRIRTQNILIRQKRLLVASHMKEWINAYENAVWSDKEFEKGDWVRVDDGSYPVDCLDSSEYATQPFKNNLIKDVA